MARVLVVDDEADVRLIARVGLEAGGHQILEATSGEEGLAILGDGGADVVLLDISLSGMDGWQVLDRIREMPGGDRLPVIMFTAHVDVRSTDEYVRGGRPWLLEKPFNRDDLLHLLEQALEGAGSE